MQFENGNQSAVKHGGEAGIKALAADKPLTGLAKQAEDEARDRLEEHGRAAMVRENAIRLQAVANLFYAAVQKAADDGNLALLDRYAARYGWLAASALRALAQLATEEKDAAKGQTNLVDVLAAMDAAREGGGNG